MDTSIFQQKGRIVNVGKTERVLSMVGGSSLIGAGVFKRGIWGLLMIAGGGYLVYRGAVGHSILYRMLNINRAGPGIEKIRVERAVTVNQPVPVVYQYWRNLENLPRFMGNVESVQVRDNRLSHWTVKAPLGQSVDWDAEISAEQENEYIGWRSVPGADIQNAGWVRFRPAPGQRGTEVIVQLQYDPPAGSLGAAFAKLTGREPDVQVREDLRRFKQILETGEIPTNEGQPFGS
ncbi:MAG TPA: SRPBCC family protein [Anaerolineaceae bacterium]|nr:SRPBCC family protein [Anaerolineaceae bacterium]